MSTLNLQNVSQWIGEKLVADVHRRRIENGEIKRKRKLGTSELLWLFLHVAAYSSTRSLHEIIKLALTDLDVNWTVSVAAFCKMRMRFSPQPSVPDLGTVGPKT